MDEGVNNDADANGEQDGKDENENFASAFVVFLDVSGAEAGVFGEGILARELVNFGLDSIKFAELFFAMGGGVSIGDGVKDFLVFFELGRGRVAIFQDGLELVNGGI